MNVKELNISARSMFCLLNAGIQMSEEIEEMSNAELLQIKNINEACVEEIRTAIQKTKHTKDLIHLFGNNLVGEMMGASNDIIEDAIKSLMRNSERQAKRMYVFETIRVRISQGAHIIIPGTKNDSGQFCFGTWNHSYENSLWFIGFTSRDTYEVEAGKDTIQMPLKGILERILTIDGIEGLVVNPGKGGSYLIDKSMIKRLLEIDENPTQRLVYCTGDITKLDYDCIVNAANTSLLGGGGVDGAIHNAAGPKLLTECKSLGGCKIGEAKITRGYELPSDYVIHTVGPVYSGITKDAELLEKCYYNSLELAKEHNIHSIAFPSISTGVYGYPVNQAARVANRTVKKWLEENTFYPIMVIFVSFDSDTDRIYRSVK